MVVEIEHREYKLFREGIDEQELGLSPRGVVTVSDTKHRIDVIPLSMRKKYSISNKLVDGSVTRT